jgi:chromosome segregation ATPase
MANKNNKSKTLVNSSKRPKPSQFEIIPTLTEPVAHAAFVSETDEPTLDGEDRGIELSDKSRSELRKILKLRSRQVADLRFQLEQATSRRRGLEKEIEVREEITTTINRDIRTAQTQLEDAANELDSLNTEYASLQKAFDETDVLAKEYAAEALRSKGAIDEKDQAIAGLERQLDASKAELADLRTYIDGRKSDWDLHQAELESLQQLVIDGDAESRQLKSDLSRRGAKLDELLQCLDASEIALAEREANIRRLAEENRSLRETLNNDSGKELREYQETIAAQSGELAGKAAEIERLRRDFERIESYSDSLRTQLKDQVRTNDEWTAVKDKLESSLDIAEDMINDLSDQLAEARVRVDELESDAERQKESFERELRQVRFELGQAHETITEHEAVNEQLNSDLIDNREFRQALESHLEEQDTQSAEQIDKLTRALRKAKNQNTEYERKLKIKDGAIADLMNELANHSSTLELSTELEKALKRIDGFRQDKVRNRRRGEANHRVAKMLIGSAEGKELRFPLFKARLSIGRTPHNDIQLNLRYVSRRHAVIATDQNGTRVIDWGSRNGLYVNQKRVTEHFLTSGDEITIGDTRLRYEERRKR